MSEVNTNQTEPITLEKVTDECLFPDGSDLCQFRIFLDFYSPALVIREMPMEGIELVDFHDVNVFLHHVHVEEMANHVHVHASVAESRFVMDLGALDIPREPFSRFGGEDLYRQHLL